MHLPFTRSLFYKLFIKLLILCHKPLLMFNELHSDFLNKNIVENSPIALKRCRLWPQCTFFYSKLMKGEYKKCKTLVYSIHWSGHWTKEILLRDKQHNYVHYISGLQFFWRLSLNMCFTFATLMLSLFFLYVIVYLYIH